MVDWQVTATTIYCDSLGEEVTVMVSKDWTVKCTGYNSNGQQGAKMAGKTSSQPRGECVGLDCAGITRYREKLQAEEARRGGK